jgi:rhamnosyltransferase
VTAVEDTGIRTGERVLAVIVTYHPELSQLGTLLGAVLPQVERVCIVDNSASPRVAEWLDQTGRSSAVRLFREASNVGVGAGHNRGIEWARAESATHVLLLDQDSIPDPDMVWVLLDAWRKLVSIGIRVSAVGPRYVDPRALTPSYFVRYGWYGKQRKVCRGGISDEVVRCDFLVSSGVLIPLDVIRVTGVMDASLFIDHVDTEWFLRARADGYSAYGVCRAVMHHHLGDARRHFWFGRQYAIAHYRPVRYYYIFRNSVLLYRRGYVPLAWKLSDIGRLAGLVLLHALFYVPRIKNFRMMMKGIYDGLHGRTGPLLEA